MLCRSYRVIIEDVPTFPIEITLPDSPLSLAAKHKAAPPLISHWLDPNSNGSAAAVAGAAPSQAKPQADQPQAHHKQMAADRTTNLQESRVQGEELSPLSSEAMDTNKNGEISAHELSAAIAESTGRWPYARKVEAGGAAIALHAVDPVLAVESTSGCCILQIRNDI